MISIKAIKQRISYTYAHTIIMRIISINYVLINMFHNYYNNHSY